MGESHSPAALDCPRHSAAERQIGHAEAMIERNSGTDIFPVMKRTTLLRSTCGIFSPNMEDEFRHAPAFGPVAQLGVAQTVKHQLVLFPLQNIAWSESASRCARHSPVQSGAAHWASQPGADGSRSNSMTTMRFGRYLYDPNDLRAALSAPGAHDRMNASTARHTMSSALPMR